ncbi:MAG TPA: FAD-dependent oxidoreductase [Lacipirellulaceae bacterium]|nr:FAD-dependent oxidoreductase [Lacipirellulaceae bacterium]
MNNYTYLILGGGMTADAAIQGIRDVDQTGSIGLISADQHPPYDRPPLTKGLWKGKPFESIWRHTEDQQGITLHLGRTVRQFDPHKKQAIDDEGNSYSYTKLLLATGGSPRRLPFGDDRIIYYRTVDDYERLRGLTQSAEHFAVIGGGFIGSEIAAALAMNGKKVTMIFPNSAIGGRMFPPELASFLNDFYRQKNVEVLTGKEVDGLQTRGDRTALSLRDIHGHADPEVVADSVVAGIGIQPNVDLAKAAGLELDDGIRVDASLRTSHPDIWAAGDVANFYNPLLDKRLRVEHEDNANTMGRIAGQSMAGKSVTYDHLPFFYSDLFELGYEAVGEVDSRLETFADWKEPYRKGVVYYLRDGRVRGVLLWNVWEQVDAARTLIAEPGPFRADNLNGRLPT